MALRIPAFPRRAKLNCQQWFGISLFHPAMSNVEFLEPRRLLSVSASTMVGLFNTAGTQSTAELMANGTVVDNDSYTVIGPATFMGQSCVETDATSTGPGGTVTTTEKNYGDLTSAGYVAYGSTAIVNEGGAITDTTTTYSPAEVILPPSMDPGTPYTETTTQTVVSSGVSNSTQVVQQSAVLTLESAQQSVTVPAGTYTCYVVDETITETSTITLSGGSPTTTGPRRPRERSSFPRERDSSNSRSVERSRN